MRKRRLLTILAFGAAAVLVGCGTSTTSDSQTTTPTCAPLVEDTLLLPEEPPDGPAACASGDCNYQTQDGCDDAQACRPQFNATDPEVHPGCESAGDGKSGDACTAQSDCARGYYCAADECHKLCCGGDWSGCPEGESCLRQLSVHAGGELLSAEASLCFPTGTCNPLTGKGCEDDPTRECKIVDPTGAVACAPRSSAGLGDECASPTVCKPGLNCVGGVCVKLCAFVQCGEPACGADEGSCVHFVRDPEGVGECTLGR
jgi:hypothetical protein